MKQKIKLRLSHVSFDNYRDNHDGYGWLCLPFVQHFLNIHNKPNNIQVTWTDKNPKENGFKKIAVSRTVNSNYLFDVTISGKFYNSVELFWSVDKIIDRDKTNIFWVKIEVID